MNTSRICICAVALLCSVSLCSCGGSGTSTVATAHAEDDVDSDQLARRRDMVHLTCSASFSYGGTVAPTSAAGSEADSPCWLRVLFEKANGTVLGRDIMSCGLRGHGGSCTIFEGKQSELIDLYNSTHRQQLPPDAKLSNVTPIKSVEREPFCDWAERPSLNIYKLGYQIVQAEVQYDLNCSSRPQECRPGDVWQVVCNTCHCDENGNASCTERGCVPEPPIPLAEESQPGFQGAEPSYGGAEPSSRL